MRKVVAPGCRRHPSPAPAPPRTHREGTREQSSWAGAGALAGGLPPQDHAWGEIGWFIGPHPFGRPSRRGGNGYSHGRSLHSILLHPFPGQHEPAGPVGTADDNHHVWARALSLRSPGYHW